MPIHLYKQLKTTKAALADFLLPPLCPATGEMVDKQGMVDAAYWQKLNFINAPYCRKCGTPFSFEAGELECGACMDNPPVFHQNRSALYYGDACKDLILKFKHGDQTHAAKTFTPWLKNAGHEILLQSDIILPVPLHRYRLIKRRYNQAEFIARDLAKSYSNIKYYPDGLFRVRQTASQGHMKRYDRERNVRKAFIANTTYDFSNKVIVIIDDVFTTGATLNECAKTLYKSGAKQVNCLTVAKVVRD